jgi:hypothetical protein
MRWREHADAPATVHPVEQKQIETNDYVVGTPMGRINDLAFELLAAEAVRHKEPGPERFEVAASRSGWTRPSRISEGFLWGQTSVGTTI